MLPGLVIAEAAEENAAPEACQDLLRALAREEFTAELD
jgi:hypothetical protein